MGEKKSLTEAFLEMYGFMRRYHMIWYGKNFCGIEPWEGQGRILAALTPKVSVSQKEIGSMLELRPQSLGELLQKLDAHGYVRRYRAENDKRALIVELTERGEEFQTNRPDYEELFSELTAKEKTALRNCLEKISAQVQEAISKELEEDTYYYY